MFTVSKRFFSSRPTGRPTRPPSPLSAWAGVVVMGTGVMVMGVGVEAFRRGVQVLEDCNLPAIAEDVKNCNLPGIAEQVKEADIPSIAAEFKKADFPGAIKWLRDVVSKGFVFRFLGMQVGGAKVKEDVKKEE